jgi:hypothetical protein
MAMRIKGLQAPGAALNKPRGMFTHVRRAHSPVGVHRAPQDCRKTSRRLRRFIMIRREMDAAPLRGAEALLASCRRSSHRRPRCARRLALEWVVPGPARREVDRQSDYIAAKTMRGDAGRRGSEVFLLFPTTLTLGPERHAPGESALPPCRGRRTNLPGDITPWPPAIHSAATFAVLDADVEGSS